MKLLLYRMILGLINTFSRSSKGLSNKISDRSVRFRMKTKAAELCGGAELFCFGDDTVRLFRDMSKITVTMSVRDSKPSDWIDFFQKDPEGLWIYLRMKNANKIIMSVGWNATVQRNVHGLHKNIIRLHEMFPNSYCMEIPNPHESVKAHMTSADYELMTADLKKINELIRNTWKEKTLKKDITLTFEGRVEK